MNYKSIFEIFNLKRYLFKNSEHSDNWNNNIKYNPKKLDKYISKSLKNFNIKNLKIKNKSFYIYLDKTGKEKLISKNNFYTLVKEFKNKILYEYIVNKDSAYVRFVIIDNLEDIHQSILNHKEYFDKYCYVEKESIPNIYTIILRMK